MMHNKLLSRLKMQNTITTAAVLTTSAAWMATSSKSKQVIEAKRFSDDTYWATSRILVALNKA